jgi:hypothetical protein
MTATVIRPVERFMIVLATGAEDPGIELTAGP